MVKNLPLVLILNQVNSVYNLPPRFFKIHFSISFFCTMVFQEISFFLSASSIKIFLDFLTYCECYMPCLVSHLDTLIVHFVIHTNVSVQEQWEKLHEVIYERVQLTLTEFSFGCNWTMRGHFL